MENCHRQPCRQRSWEGGDEKIKMQEDCFCIWRDRAPENKATKSNPERRAANSKHSGVSTCSHPEAGWASGGIAESHPYLGRTSQFHACQMFSETSNLMENRTPSKFISI